MKNAIMNNNMLKRTLFLTLSLIVGCCSAVAQQLKFNGFSGEAKSFYYDFSLSGTFHKMFVVDGDPYVDPHDPNPNAQYNWEFLDWSISENVDPENFQVDVSFDDNTASSPIVTIDIANSMTQRDIELRIFILVTRVSKYGTQKEVLAVRVTNKITVFATPNNNCWSDGDEVKISDFSLVVDPPECKDYIDIDRDSREADFSVPDLCGISKFKVYFTYMEERLDDASSEIVVINDDYVVASTSGGSQELKNIMDAIERIRQGEKYVKKAEEITKPVRKHLKKVEFDPSSYDRLDVGIKQCCCDGKIIPFVTLNGSIGVDASIGAEFNAWRVVIFPIVFNGGLDFSPDGIDIALDDDFQKCNSLNLITITAYLELQVGAGVKVYDDLYVVVKGVGGFTGQLGINFKNGQWSFGNVKCYAKVRIEASYLFGKATYEYLIAETKIL